MEKLPKIGLPILIGVVLLIIVLAKSAVTLDSGHAGVLYETLSGGVDPDKAPLGPGFHVIAPWNRVIDYETRQQEVAEKMAVLSSNGLDIKLDASILYQPDVKSLGKLHNQKGEDYLSRVLQPAIRSAARSVVGRYTPEQLYSSKRDAIQEEIFEETKKIVEPQFIQLNDILIRDVGKAESNRILSASLTDKILQDKGIEATVKLSESPNSKTIIIGSGDSGLPIILGNQ